MSTSWTWPGSISCPESKITAAVMNDLAILYQELGRYADAEPLYRRSLAIEKSNWGCEPSRRGRQPEQPGEPVQGDEPSAPTPSPS